MINTPARFTIRALLAALFFTGVVGAPSVVLPTGAGAYATIAPPPIYSTAPGLPDGRVYELVSPANKDGNQAGAGTDVESRGAGTGQERYALAAPDGDSVLFEGTGPMGETPDAYDVYFVATRSSGGWTTRSVMPSAQQTAAEIGGTHGAEVIYVDPSSDLSHVMFKTYEGTYATDVPPGAKKCREQAYLSGPDPFVPAAWLERPEIPNPIGSCAGYQTGRSPVGGTPDFSTVYFTFPGTLLAEDASRIAGGGFYEDSEGTLREAGVLPDGSLSPFGATPAVAETNSPTTGEETSVHEGNEVSADGSRAFFLSPAPGAGAPEPPQLYVRESGAKTVLVSRDALLPDVGELPAPAPDGALALPNESYVFASPDGSQAFFQSEDRLTSAAPEGPPGNTSRRCMTST